ncbi:putative cell shape-determining protein [Streptococcus criceti]|uniref:Cell shape-determining protein MreC n=1 Tax=Streptococcus criceti HS-6 TaxID=873449 RepID=G5JPZ1_STRCG|nr:rod shape-determining protein MreC [Streptococcus criceti]EHI74372.1 rod shape-determining protein MreC family protein [Streptococcus criceti HS-6]SUN41901.1 putative cell shape-determining protein [Streptococcus criceti]
MKKIRFSRVVTLSVTSLLIALVLLFFIFRNTVIIKNITIPISGVTSKVDKVISYPFQLISTAKDDLIDLFNTYDENESLKRNLAEMKDQSSDLSTLKEENKSLSKALEVEKNFSSYKTITSKVTVRSTLSWYESLTISVGKSDGVSDNMLAVSDGGLVGRVSNLTSSDSSLQLVSNSEGTYEIPVKMTGSAGDVYGILTGYNAKKNVLIIEELNADKELKKDDNVITSGLDGKSIAGISVGKISSISDAKELSKRKVYVTPTADLDNISYVTLIGN